MTRTFALFLSFTLALPAGVYAVCSDWISRRAGELSRSTLREEPAAETEALSGLEEALRSGPERVIQEAGRAIQNFVHKSSPPSTGLEESENETRPLRVTFPISLGEKVRITLPTGEVVELSRRKTHSGRARVVIRHPLDHFGYRRRSLQDGAVGDYTLWKTRRAIVPLHAQGDQGYERLMDDAIFLFPAGVVKNLLQRGVHPKVWCEEAPYLFEEIGPNNGNGSVRIRMSYREPADFSAMSLDAGNSLTGLEETRERLVDQAA